MAKYLIEDTTLIAIGDAIREKEGSTEVIPVPDIPARIRTIPGIDTSDATATAADLASGKTAYVKGEKVTGSVTTIENGGTGSVFNCTPDYFGAGGIINAVGTFSQDRLYRAGSIVKAAMNKADFGNATAADVAAGKIFTSAEGVAITGTAAGGAAKVVKITTSTRSHTLSITGLSKSDYGYLLGCNTIMIYGEAGWGAYDLHSAICTIGSGVLNSDKYGTYNKQICVGPSYSFETGMNDIQEVSIVEESAGIKISIVAESQYFTADSNYYVVGFNV